GVGRNIAHNLTLLGQKTLFISVFGDDVFAGPLVESCRSAGIDLSLSPALAGESTAVYLFIAGAGGEMELAVSDMGIYDRVTPAFLEARMDAINAAALCAADTNIPRESLEYLALHSTVPLFVDPVSTAKAEKLRGLLSRVAMLKANALETELLTGIAITDEDSLAAAARALLDQGLGLAVITLGGEGVYCATTQESCRLPVFAGPVRNVTGAGDSFMAAFIWAHLRDFSLEQSARAGLAAASLCIAGEETVCPDLNADTIMRMLRDTA
ncbi:MAG: PfkB family carbohydrate kinase, partial [Treponema sp.]|nr:PfkB family carbohydrate kinase [Treponema sp.]